MFCCVAPATSMRSLAPTPKQSVTRLISAESLRVRREPYRWRRYQAFTVVALAVDAVSVALPPPADAAGLALAKEIAAVPSEVSTVADVVGVGSAGIALGADELAEVPAAEKTAQIESDKKALESRVWRFFSMG